ncbi:MULTISPECIES: polyketide synthase dehydratase domain-containing protein [unclassified Rhizobacter]|uniref:polyketide synthase dehydratase domain-containing protein n=1 Tax=unclassified Rhizobacter TaxID=2640088 RepID=UPI0006FC6281|nr:hypothetical protein ASC88_20305 [Rhizobacter sp. Root29]KQW15911.1 hypothetical protein ASC98_01525 [Rhizobacter sp. Root1238]KRB25026.1 hypothetical protein ASE08_02260 [Rhizobacter sp. Root16D2]
MAGADGAWTLHAQARIAALAPPSHDTAAPARLRTQPAVRSADLYARLDATGAKFGAALHGIAQAWFAPAEALAQLAPTADERFGIAPAALDACFQLMVTLAPPGALWLPTQLDGLVLERLGAGARADAADAFYTLPSWCRHRSRRPANGP